MKPTNSDDVIDSKDILSYIKDKENDRDFELENFIKDFCDEHSDYDKALENLEDGITFIRYSYFEDYMLNYFLQFNQVDEALECYIDIEAFAQDQQYNYTSIDFDGIKYWYHNC
jgi:hypothetical protein